MAPTIADVRRIAQVCHEANRAYCRSIGDESQVEWQYASEWQKDSALSGVLAAVFGGYRYSPADSHKGWLAEKERDGWTYGPTKDPVAKTHPCMVPYDQLPEEQRRKDALFLAVVRALTGDLS